MGVRILAIIAAIALAIAAPPAEAQQPRAPAGGMYVNGHFYKGGQFIPQGAGGMSPMFMPDFSAASAPGPAPAYVPPSVRRKARLAARSSARTDYRTAARSGGGSAAAPSGESDAEKRAWARIEMARKLIAAGKTADAREWLDKVVEMNASRATVGEAKKLLAGLEGPRRSPVPERG